VSAGVLTSGTTAFTDTVFHAIVVSPTTTPSIFFSFNNAAPATVLTNSVTGTPGIPVYGKVIPQALYATSGTPSSSTFYRGDGQWQTPVSSGGYVFGGTVGGSTATPEYMTLSGASNNTPQARYITPISAAMTFDAIYIYGYCSAVSAGSSSTFTVTLYVNGSPTALTANFTAPSTAVTGNTFTANLTGQSVSVSAGDQLQLVYVMGTPSTGPLVVVTTSIHAQ